MKEFRALLREGYIILDGATGTELAKLGMPKGVSPEKWVLEHRDEVIEFQRKYVDNGSDVIYAPTFSGNRIKLKEFGLENDLYKINKDLVRLSKEAANGRAFVAGDMSPTGQFIKPFGPLLFEEVIDIYKEQAKALFDAGVDLFVIETMMDIMETRAAVIAVKETCDLPVIVTMTFNEDGRTLMGSDPKTVCVTLQSLGVDALGCNCSTGPDKMFELLMQMKEVAKVPLIAKPNAGMPILRDGKTVFDMTVDEFVEGSLRFIESGVKIFGGCCGTDYTFIKELSKKIKSSEYKKVVKSNIACLSSSKSVYEIENNSSFSVIGERINPTGKKDLQEALIAQDYFEIVDMAEDQIENGANILDVNVGMAHIDEKEAMINAIEHLNQYANIPLCIDSSNIDVIEEALRRYPGRALVNSVSYEKHKIERLLPIVKKYGAMFILLPLEDGGIATEPDKRKVIVKKIYDCAIELGFEASDMVVDGLVMTASSNQKAVKTTLETIKYAKELGTFTVVGLSNVSFGLPNRQNINHTFLAMAMGYGLDFAIMNPSDKLLMDTAYAGSVLYNRDVGSQKYIERFGSSLDSKKKRVIDHQEKNPEDVVYLGVLEGKKQMLLDGIDKLLENKKQASEIVDGILIPAINEVGILYEKQKYYLPQLIKSAEAMQEAFSVLEPLLESNQSKRMDKVVVLATVKGDIHDIGKNIVGLMLKNYGFNVIDLGKDVSNIDIINASKENNADIIGLSALMTTTMTEMKEIVRMVKESALDAKVMIGGAVLSQKYCDEIGAHAYAKDAYGAVKCAKELVGFKEEE